jgi:choline dehydrogenase-like flavoprotein
LIGKPTMDILEALNPFILRISLTTLALFTLAMAFTEEYDFIIVGGGTAGLVVANRLTANPSVQVLVLEAGEDHTSDPRSMVPAMWQSQLGTEVDWDYVTTAQVSTSCLRKWMVCLIRMQAGLNGRSIGQPQGKVLGGSSVINGMAYIPPSKVAIDQWGRFGNPNWDFATLEPYYKKSREVEYPSDTTSEYLGLNYNRSQTEGDKGPIHVSFTGTLGDKLSRAWFETFQNLGWGLSADPFSGKVTGGFSSAASIDNTTKTRSHAASAYYAPVASRPNLHVQTSVYVERILLRGSSDDVTAYGVLWTKDNEKLTANARREVILAAGAYGSPKLLELSGIGSSKILRPLGINVVVDNPSVGENLQDHLMTGISYEVVDGVNTLDDLLRQVPETIESAMEEYQSKQSGPLTLAGLGSFGVMPVLDFQTDAGKARLKRLLAEHGPGESGVQPAEQEYFEFVKSIVSSKEEGSGAFWMAPVQGKFDTNGSAAQLGQDLKPGYYVTIGTSLLYPFSRGHAHISSADPAARPTIDTNSFQNPLDLEIFARHLTFVEKLAQTSPLRDLLKDPINCRTNPETNALTLEQAKTWARKAAISNWHPVGTCSMLPRNKGGVVGADLKVHGVKKGLRIVDSSIMPVITRGFPQMTVYAVAERAADIILSCYGGQKNS